MAAATRSGGGGGPKRAAGAELSLGARAQTPSGLVGTVRFIGPTQFSAGTWVGIELEAPAGKNDGSVNGVRYFQTAANHGVFVKENQATVLAAASPAPTPTSPTPSEESTASASTATTAGGSRTMRSRLAELKEKRDAVLQKANKLTAASASTSSTRMSLSATDSSTGIRRPTPTNATRPPRASLGVGSTAGGPIRASLGVGATTTTTARRASLAPSGSTSRLPTPSATAARTLAASGSTTSLPSAAGSRRASLTATTTPRASLGGRGAPPATIQEEGGGTEEGASQSKDGAEKLAASLSNLRVDTSVALPVVRGDEDEEEDADRQGGDFQFTDDADGADRIVNLSLSGSGTGTGTGGSGSESGSGVRIGRMSIYDMGRRISLGGREGDLSSQVNGLRMLLDRKNTELEALRARAEEGQAALQAGDGLRARAEAAEAAAAAKEEEATRLGLEVERLRAALAEEEGRRRAREAEEGQIGEEAARYRTRCQELEAKGEEQAKKLVELEAEVRGLTAKAQHAQEEEKGKWAELAREKAAVATGARRVAELEAQVASLNDMVELLSLDKEQLLLDQELLEERAEELSLELETAKLELEHAATSSPAASLGGADEGGADVAALAEQNGRLRAALKRLQELSAHEKAELLRRQRDLEREVAQMEGEERQARELREWRAVKEQELEELHEMVEAAQAFESMVESLTTKNLELEERVADLRVAVSELEIAQELSEELEAQQAAEAQALRRDLERLSVQLSEREHALRQAEMRAGDQDRALARLRGLAKELAAERDGLRGQVAQGTTALGQVRDQAQGVLGQVQALRAQAERLRAAGMAAARARIEAAAAGVRAARVGAWLPRAAVEREAAALEGELTLGRLAGKVEVAWQQLADGAGAALALAQGADVSGGSDAPHHTRHAESPVERLDRAAHEGRVVHALGRAQRLAHFLLLRLRHPSRPLAPDRALAVAAEAASLLGPVERGVDEVLGVLQEEGGVPEAHSPLSQLEERIVGAEAGLSLLHGYADEEEDGGTVTRGLWAQATAHAQLRSAPLLVLLLAGQAYTVAREQGLLPPAPEEEEKVEAPAGAAHAPEALALLERLADLARTGAPRHVGRCLAAAAGLDEYHAAAVPAEALDPVLNATGRVVGDFATAAAALRDVLGGPASPSDARFQGALRALVAAWEGMLGSLPSNAVPALEAVEPASGEPAGPLLLALLGEGKEEGAAAAAAEEVRARLEEAVTMGPLLEAARESERALGQALRDKEREEEALRAQVDSLEELLQRAAVRDEAAEEAHEEMARLLEEKERLEQETQVLSEALEVVQQQADALESENKRLKSLQSVTSPVAAGPPLPSQSAAQSRPHSHQQQPQDMPLVAAAALATMHRALRHAGREVGYWRAAATRQGLLHGLQPLACPTTTCAAASLPPPEAAGRGAEAEEEARAQLRRTLQEVNRLAARVHTARCAPRVVRLRLAGGGGKEAQQCKTKGTASASASGSAACDACVRGEVETAKLAMDYRRLRAEVEQVLGAYRAAAATAGATPAGAARPAAFIRKAPVLDIAAAKGAATVAEPRLVGRVRVRLSMETDQEPQQPFRPQCIPVRVGDHHLRLLAERFGVLA